MSAIITTLVPESSEPTAAIERYEDAYRAAESTVAFGEIVKRGGIFFGGVICIGALVAFQLNPAERYGFPEVSASLIACAALLVLISHILSAGFQAFGQLLKATIDSDVNSSPFLSNAQRAMVMSLRKQPPVPDSISLTAA